jgi:hypothetical protein
MTEDEMPIEILSTDCPVCEMGKDLRHSTVNTLTGEAECECGETWTYGSLELLEILNNLED